MHIYFQKIHIYVYITPEVVLRSCCLSLRTVIVAGHRTLRHRAPARRQHLPHRHIHTIQKRQADQVSDVCLWLFTQTLV